MLHKTVSARAVIQQVISRFGIKGEGIEYDALEWIGAGIGLIGTHVNFVNLIDEVEVNFHKIVIPERMYQLNFIVYNGQKLRHGIGQASHFSHQENSTDDPLVVDLIKTIFVKNELATIIEGIDPCCDDLLTEDLMNKQTNVNNKIEHLVDFIDQSSSCSGSHWYSDSESDCYNTSIENGTVYISYKAYPVDKDGIPLIIDEVKYRLALEWYVVRCLMERGFRHPTLDYSTVDFKTNRAILSAQNEHLKMTYEEADNFAENWTNMLFQRDPDNRNYFSN